MAHYTEDELTLYHYGEAPRRDRIEWHLQECESCAATYRDIARTLALVGDLDVPERDERYGLEMWQRIRHDLPPREVPWFMGLMAWHRFALVGAVAVLIVAAFVAGRHWPGSASVSQDALQASNLADLRGELREMREMLTLSLMQQQSATERLRGVSGSVEIDQPGNEIVGALLDTLMHDANVNVRLACVDALRRFSGQDQVRRGTIQALRESSFPLVQIALIDYMVETKDKGAADALQRLSEDSMVNEAVRGRAVWGLQQLKS
jgi:HEAT repeats